MAAASAGSVSVGFGPFSFAASDVACSLGAFIVFAIALVAIVAIVAVAAVCIARCFFGGGKVSSLACYLSTNCCRH